MRMKWWVAGLALISLMVAIVILGLRVSEPRLVPRVGVTTLKGEQFHLDDMKGEVVLVNFWATTCAVCIREMPRLIALFEKYRSQGYRTLAVAMPYDPPNRVVDYTTRRGLPFDVVMDIDGSVLRAFGDVPGTPTSFLVNKRGQIVRKYLGEPDFDDLERRIREAIAESV